MLGTSSKRCDGAIAATEHAALYWAACSGAARPPSRLYTCNWLIAVAELKRIITWTAW